MKAGVRPVRVSAAPVPREVRIIGGLWRRSKLPVLDKPGLRPTPDRVRETLFNWLGQDLTGWRVLDMFAGSGALGMEAASRGATPVVLVEQDAAVVRQLRANVKRLAGDSAACPIEVLAGDVFSHMTGWGPASFDLVFIDPPFAAQWFDRALDAACRVVSPQGFIYLESDQPFAHERLQVYREMQAGTVQARLLRPCGHE